MNFIIKRFEEASENIAFVHNDCEYSFAWILQRFEFFTNFLRLHKVDKSTSVILHADYSPDVFAMILALIDNKNIIVPLTKESVVELDTVKVLAENSFNIDMLQADILVRPEPNGVIRNKLMLSLLRLNRAGLLLFSSGSTGKPKGILHDFEKVLEKFKEQRPSYRAIVFLMLDHFGGINTLFHLLANLGTVVTISKRDVNSICSAIEKNKIELLPTTPSFLNLLIQSGVYNDYDLTSLKLITYGTEVMPQTTLQKVKEVLPNVRLQQTYGLSELGVLSSRSECDDTLWVKLGGQGFQTKVKDQTLWIKSDFAMLGYLNADSPFDSEGWFNTQDIVEVQGEYFRILGRSTDLINVGGNKVYPAEIENLLLTLHNIKDVAITSEPNVLLGNIVVAKVVLESEEPINEVRRRIREFCKSKLASYKIPSKVIVTTESLYSARQKKLRSFADKGTFTKESEHTAIDDVVL